MNFASVPVEVQRDDRVGLFALRPGRRKARKPPNAKPGHDRECQQYPDENESIYHQIADVIALGGNVLVEGHGGLIADLGEQPFGGIGVGRI